jgi:hypothetical protein
MPNNMGNGFLDGLMMQQGAMVPPTGLSPAEAQASEVRAPQPQMGFLDRLQSGVEDNRGMLMGLGSGLLSRGWAGVGDAMPGMEYDENRRAMEEQQAQMEAQRAAQMRLGEQYGVDPLMFEAGMGDFALQQALTPSTPERIDPVRLGQNDILVNPVTGEIVGRGMDGQQQEVQQQRRAIIAAEPGAASSIQLADQLANHAGLNAATGVIEGNIPLWLNPRNYTPGQLVPALTGGQTRMGAAADFRALAETLGGRAFLEARRALRGGGSITDFEGQRAEAAIANMRTSQSAEQFQTALREFQQSIATGMLLLENPDMPVTQADIDAYIAQATGRQAPPPDDVQVPQTGGGQVLNFDAQGNLIQ